MFSVTGQQKMRKKPINIIVSNVNTLSSSRASTPISFGNERGDAFLCGPDAIICGPVNLDGWVAKLVS